MAVTKIDTPFKDAAYKASTDSKFEGAVYAGGDIRVADKDVVIGGPQISEEPNDLFDYLKGLK